MSWREQNSAWLAEFKRNDTSIPGGWRCTSCGTWHEMPPWTGSKKRGSGAVWPVCCGERAEWVSSKDRTASSSAAPVSSVGEPGGQQR